MGIVESAPFQMRTKLEAASESAENVPGNTVKIARSNKE
jgi:hypothetical protein